MRASLLALVLLCLAPTGRAQPPDSEQASAASDDSANVAESDWSPLSGPTRALKAALRDIGIRLDLDTAFYGQRASRTISGNDALAAAHSRALAKLSADIAAAIRADANAH